MQTRYRKPHRTLGKVTGGTGATRPWPLESYQGAQRKPLESYRRNWGHLPQPGLENYRGPSPSPRKVTGGWTHPPHPPEESYREPSAGHWESYRKSWGRPPQPPLESYRGPQRWPLESYQRDWDHTPPGPSGTYRRPHRTLGIVTGGTGATRPWPPERYQGCQRKPLESYRRNWGHLPQPGLENYRRPSPSPRKVTGLDPPAPSA